MKYLFIFLIFAGCSTATMTSYSLRDRGLDQCKNVPELDMQRNFCIFIYIKDQCTLNNYDIRICGELERQ